MKVELISYPVMDEKALCGEAAAICINGDKPEKSLRHALESGHDSVLEHATYTFRIEDVSRTLLAQLTRHRLASFSVMSQRYVDMEDVPVVIPKSIRENPEALDVFNDVVGLIRTFYHECIEAGIPKEDARYLLPSAACTSLIMSMNARELRHFFSLRCCNRAQWEIRELADAMLRLVRAKAPSLFADAGPGCVNGGCKEKRPCGAPRALYEWEEKQ